MKKMKWNQFLLAGLQLFADGDGGNGDDGADGAGADGGAGNSSGSGSDGKNGGEPKGKEGDGKEAKYTDDDLDRIPQKRRFWPADQIPADVPEVVRRIHW